MRADERLGPAAADIGAAIARLAAGAELPARRQAQSCARPPPKRQRVPDQLSDVPPVQPQRYVAREAVESSSVWRIAQRAPALTTAELGQAYAALDGAEQAAVAQAYAIAGFGVPVGTDK